MVEAVSPYRYARAREIKEQITALQQLIDRYDGMADDYLSQILDIRTADHNDIEACSLAAIAAIKRGEQLRADIDRLEREYRNL